MARFAHVDSTGKILWTGVCPDYALAIQVPQAGCSIIPITTDENIKGKTHAYDFATKSFVLRTTTLSELQIEKMRALGVTNINKIVGGFTSDALGTSNFYGSNPTDQANMHRVAIVGGLLMCAPNSSQAVWSLVAHTRAQGLKVLQDFGTMADAARANLATKKAAASAATTTTAVNAIVT